MVSCLITIKGTILYNSFEIASLSMAIFFWFLYTSFAIFTWLLMITRYHHFSKHSPYREYYNRRFSSFYFELKQDKMLFVMYHPVYLMQRSIVAYLLIFGTYNYILQLSIFIFVQVGVNLLIIFNLLLDDIFSDISETI